MVIFSKTQQTHNMRLCYIYSISYSGHIFVWVMHPVWPSNPLGACRKIFKVYFWESSIKNLFPQNRRGFESKLGHLSFIAYLLLTMTIVWGRISWWLKRKMLRRKSILLSQVLHVNANQNMLSPNPYLILKKNFKLRWHSVFPHDKGAFKN